MKTIKEHVQELRKLIEKEMGSNASISIRTGLLMSDVQLSDVNDFYALLEDEDVTIKNKDEYDSVGEYHFASFKTKENINFIILLDDYELEELEALLNE